LAARADHRRAGGAALADAGRRRAHSRPVAHAVSPDRPGGAGQRHADRRQRPRHASPVRARAPVVGETAGPPADSGSAPARRRARELRVAERVAFSGPVTDADREALFDAASIVVLASPAENFGLVVAEALVRGIPAVATTGAPWQALAEEGCGWVSAPDPGA